MADDVAVVIAYRDYGDLHRRAAFAYVLAHYIRLDYAIVIEEGTAETFTRARAINTAVRNCDATVIVQSDPDSLIPDPTRLRQAIGMAAESDGLVIPHDQYLYLTEPATADVLHGRRAVTDVGPGDCHDHGANGSGNVVVFSRATWEQARGFDERFGMIAGDDAAFAISCAALVAPTRRLAGGVVHMWHPRSPASDPTTFEYVEQFALLAEYRDALAKGPGALGRLVRSR